MAKGFNLAEVQEVCGSADTVSLNPGEFLFHEKAIQRTRFTSSQGWRSADCERQHGL